MFSEVINYLSIRLGDIPITTLISSSALIALLIFLVNEYKERHRFQLYCRILYQEVELHHHWLDILYSGDFSVSELLLSPDTSKDWDKLKYEPTFLRIKKNNFDILLLHYQEIRSLQFILKKSIESKFYIITQDQLIHRRINCINALKLLKKLAHIK